MPSEVKTRLAFDQFLCYVQPSVANVALKTLAEFQAIHNDKLMGSLNSVSKDQIEPSVKMVLDLKEKIDGQVKSVMQPINSFSVQGSQALFGLS